MMNKKKVIGLLMGGAGVFLARIDIFMQLEKTLLFSLNALGILIAFAGIAVYGSGMPSTLKRFKACPGCFTKNDATATVCKKCKQTFPGSSAEETVQ